MNENRKWEDIHREDLKMIPAMTAKGWTPEFSAVDVRHLRTNPQYLPHDAVTFIKGSTHAWRIHSGWKVADIADGHYRNHRSHKTLSEILEKENTTNEKNS